VLFALRSNMLALWLCMSPVDCPVLSPRAVLQPPGPATPQTLTLPCLPLPRVAEGLATLTPGFSGADIAGMCHTFLLLPTPQPLPLPLLLSYDAEHLAALTAGFRGADIAHTFLPPAH
jgi:hypothetical protein